MSEKNAVGTAKNDNCADERGIYLKERVRRTCQKIRNA